MKPNEQQDPIAWARHPSPAHISNSRRGSHWETAIVDLAEQQDPRFVEILREHVSKGVIRSDRAKLALGMSDAAA